MSGVTSDAALYDRILLDAYVHDLSLDRDVSCAPPSLKSCPTSQSLVYTAFDGDHFALVPFMRQHVLRNGRVPISPESVIGYKDSVDAYQDKKGVLRADLAILNKCDDLWIYTDLPAHPESIPRLAEGAVIELLWHVRRNFERGIRPSVQFVSIAQLATRPVSQVNPVRVELSHGFVNDAVERSLPELLTFVGSVEAEGLPPVALLLHDPLDTKYADWLRAESHRKGWVPVVPALAIELGDGYGSRPLIPVLRAWMQLSRIADEYWLFDSINSLPEAAFVAVMRQALDGLGKPAYAHDWSEFAVPKAKFGSDWPLTGREGRGQPYARAALKHRGDIIV